MSRVGEWDQEAWLQYARTGTRARFELEGWEVGGVRRAQGEPRGGERR